MSTAILTSEDEGDIMATMRNKRAAYLISVYPDVEITGIGFEGYNYTDFYCYRNGDCILFRVRDYNNTYLITER